jgi:hypothetical protein
MKKYFLNTLNIQVSRYHISVWVGIILMIAGNIIAPCSIYASPPEELKIFQLEAFDFIYPHTSFTQPETRSVSIRMAANEYESGVFAVVAHRDFSNVTLKIDEPVNGGSKIDVKNIDVRIVKVWKQAGVNWILKAGDHEVMVPELLLRDDTAPLVDSWQDKTYAPPSLSQSFRTDLTKGQSKQMVLTVKTGTEENPPGTYIGKLHFMSEGKPLKNVDLRIEVLPLVLPEPPKRNVIYFRGRVRPEIPDHLTKNEYLRQLADIRAHGFNGLTVYDGGYADLCEAVDRAASAGFRTVVAMSFSPRTPETVGKIREYCEKNGLEVYFYGADEPNKEARLKAHMEKSAIIHKGGGKVVTAITRERDIQLDSPGSAAYARYPKGTHEPLDWANYHLGASRDYVEGLARGTFPRAKTAKMETYYWQIMQEDPAMHRLYSGFYLWRTKLDGMFPYCYQHMFEGFSPYNSGDKHPISGNRLERGFFVTYPSQEGPVPTLQWEAIREGIDDTRYLAKLEQLTKTKKVDLGQEMDSILQGFDYVGFYSSGTQKISGKRFREARERIIALILKLQGL